MGILDRLRGRTDATAPAAAASVPEQIAVDDASDVDSTDVSAFGEQRGDFMLLPPLRPTFSPPQRFQHSVDDFLVTHRPISVTDEPLTHAVEPERMGTFTARTRRARGRLRPSRAELLHRLPEASDFLDEAEPEFELPPPPAPRRLTATARPRQTPPAAPELPSVAEVHRAVVNPAPAAARPAPIQGVVVPSAPQPFDPTTLPMAARAENTSDVPVLRRRASRGRVTQPILSEEEQLDDAAPDVFSELDSGSQQVQRTVEPGHVPDELPAPSAADLPPLTGPTRVRGAAMPTALPVATPSRDEAPLDAPHSTPMPTSESSDEPARDAAPQSEPPSTQLAAEQRPILSARTSPTLPAVTDALQAPAADDTAPLVHRAAAQTPARDADDVPPSAAAATSDEVAPRIAGGPAPASAPAQASAATVSAATPAVVRPDAVLGIQPTREPTRPTIGRSAPLVDAGRTGVQRLARDDDQRPPMALPASAAQPRPAAVTPALSADDRNAATTTASAPEADSAPEPLVLPVPVRVQEAVAKATGSAPATVPVHQGDHVDAMADEIKAQAFTRDGEIHLASDVAIGTPRAEEVLAHELTHVVQQQAQSSAMPAEHSDEGQEHEQQAREVQRALAEPPADAPVPELAHPAAPEGPTTSSNPTAAAPLRTQAAPVPTAASPALVSGPPAASVPAGVAAATGASASATAMPATSMSALAPTQLARAKATASAGAPRAMRAAVPSAVERSVPAGVQRLPLDEAPAAGAEAAELVHRTTAAPAAQPTTAAVPTPPPMPTPTSVAQPSRADAPGADVRVPAVRGGQEVFDPAAGEDRAPQERAPKWYESGGRLDSMFSSSQKMDEEDEDDDPRAGLERQAASLYPLIRARLRAELVRDRERRGRLAREWR